MLDVLAEGFLGFVESLVAIIELNWIYLRSVNPSTG
jgi:hypothetical protein